MSNLIIFLNMTVHHLLDLFDKYIEPILSFSCEILEWNEAVKLENVHLQLGKAVLGSLYTYTATLYLLNPNHACLTLI